MTIETIATFSNGVWTRPVPGYSRPHVPGGNITLTPADRVVATNCLFGDENTTEYVAWAAVIDKAIAGGRRKPLHPDPIRAQLLAALKECLAELGMMSVSPAFGAVLRARKAIMAAEKPQ